MLARIFAGLLLFALSTAAVSAPTYRVTEIAAIIDGRIYANPSAVNELGQFVGVSWDFDSGVDLLGYLWDPKTKKFTLLPPLGPSADGSSFSYAASINNKSKIVGTSSSPNGRRATMWGNAVPRGLALFAGQTRSEASDINDSGYVVGSYEAAQNGGSAVRWGNGTSIELGFQKHRVNNSSAFAINNSGFIVGRFQIDDWNRAYQWDPGTGSIEFFPQRPDDDDAQDDQAFDISNAGRVVGGSGGQAVSWNADTLVIKDYQPGSGDACCSHAYKINTKKEILASMNESVPGTGLVYILGNQIVRLQNQIRPGGALQGCVRLGDLPGAINNKGVVVVDGVNICTGQPKIYVLTPI